LPGVSCITSAASLAGVLTLTGTATSVFIIQINGRFDMAANAEILLSGGAEIANVFFQVNGVFAMGTNSVFRGTVITGPGAIELATGAAVYGRALACGGAISLDNNIGILAQAVLPILLSDFTATHVNNKTIVKWTTQSEINTKEFIVEHSTTGARNTWTSKGSVVASGHSTSARHYTITDNSPSFRDNYYRLKSVDNDNTFSLSQVKYVYVAKASAELINAYPIPFNDVINITGVEKGSTIILSDLSGKTIKQQSAVGSGNEKIYSSNLSTGSYFIKIIHADGRTTGIKINKQ
jgi:hypothetical protein